MQISVNTGYYVRTLSYNYRDASLIILKNDVLGNIISTIRCEKDYRIIQKVIYQPGLPGNDYKVAALYKSLNSYPLRTDRL